METDEQIEGTRGKVKIWLKNNENLILLGVLLLAIVVRLYYFTLTKTQPLWWDELAYGSLAKNYITHMWDGTGIIIGETLIRPFLFPAIWSFLMGFGIGEEGARFLLEFIPSVLSVFFVYLIGKEVYGKKVGLVSAFIFSVLWIHLFYSSRLLTGVPSLALLLLSVYYFIKSTKDEFVGKYLAISLILLSFSTIIRYPNGLVFVVYLIFFALVWRLELIKKAKFLYSGLIGISPILLFFLYNFITKGNIFPALFSGDYGGEVGKSFAFEILNFIPLYLKSAFFVFFIIGLVIAIFELFIGYDKIKMSLRIKGHLIMLLLLVVVYSYFIFQIRGAEDRWLFPVSLSMVIFTGFGLMEIYKYLKKYGKTVVLVLMLVILAFGAYQQITAADELIKDKKTSFLQMRQGFEWIKENTPEDIVILGQGIEPYAIYYAERKYEALPENEEEVNNIEADYLIVHMFSVQPNYINNYLFELRQKMIWHTWYVVQLLKHLYL